MCFKPQEYVVDPDPLRDTYQVFENLPVAVDGWMTVSELPGIGIKPDETALRNLVTEG